MVILGTADPANGDPHGDTHVMLGVAKVHLDDFQNCRSCVIIQTDGDRCPNVIKVR